MATTRGIPSPPIAPPVGPGGYLSQPWLIFVNDLVQFIANRNLYGTAADRPAADAVYPGTVYFETDTLVTYISTGTTWEPYSPAGVSVDPAGAIDGDGSVGAPLAVLVDGNSVVINGTNELEALLRKSVTTLTNAQILALPTTPIELLAAPGAGLWYRVVAVSYSADCAAGAYTNIDAAYADIRLGFTGGQDYVAGFVADDAASTPVDVDLTGLLGTANHRVAVSQAYLSALLAGAADGYVRNWLATGIANLENLPLEIAANNSASGNFTGGNAANTLRVTTYYVIETL